MKIQITLTVAEAKRIIALGICKRIDVQKALSKGKVLLKGGTTVSAIAEELTGHPLRIGGRITPRGTMNTLRRVDNAHCILIEGKNIENVDATIDEIVAGFGRDDIIIASANAIDKNGDAAMMAAAPLGHIPGKAVAGFMTQGSKVIIASGLEKLIPGTIRDAVLAAGRTTIDKSFGAAVGLIPIFGELVTEREALMELANVNVTVIGAGGIEGAEGATTLVVEGEEADVENIFNLVTNIKGSSTSAIPESLIECRRGCPQCKRHLACVYKLGIIKE